MLTASCLDRTSIGDVRLPRLIDASAGERVVDEPRSIKSSTLTKSDFAR